MSTTIKNPVLDKVPCIFVCGYVPDTQTEKHGRSGQKYLATNLLNPDLVRLLKKQNVKFTVTAKVDGTCTLVRNHQLYKRRDIKSDRKIPDTWEQTGNGNGNHLIGFMPLEKGDKWHYDCHVTPDNSDGKGEAQNYDLTRIRVLKLNADKTALEYVVMSIEDLEGKSVEVMGPKFQGNPHGLTKHCIMIHGEVPLDSFPDMSKFVEEHDQIDVLGAMKDWFAKDATAQLIEGVVIHFESGELFKVHRHHLDIEWDKSNIASLEDIRLV
jgi:hypothetical protein